MQIDAKQLLLLINMDYFVRCHCFASDKVIHIYRHLMKILESCYYLNTLHKT